MGWEVLMKVLTQEISIYAMGIFKFSKGFCKFIQSILVQNNPKSMKVHWVGNSQWCNREEGGGLGFQDLDVFNDVV